MTLDINKLIGTTGDKPRYLPAHKVYQETGIWVNPEGHCQWCGKALPKRCKRFCPSIEVDDGRYPLRRQPCADAMFAFWGKLPAFKKAVFVRDDFTCKACGERYTTINEHGTVLPDLSMLEVDHIIPVSKGGSCGMDNLQTLCFKCNRHKSNKIIDYRQLKLIK